ncbi:hypothetical protein HPC49_05370 [Pyxidicoccus fallax]|uniref:Porin n=1 Tax=Pyxidicoccus fallax TaxID=394095 RepID=A0A848L8Z2_9BACT|nr:DcaP family trimeric outer membrane transporter [Pyxidicoccus fallax]NMO14722.1 hypothetical protein [Pyxidicoccus fallax]NPC77683.1 hypothetical protein [Pyxidicoccus fallax]
MRRALHGGLLCVLLLVAGGALALPSPQAPDGGTPSAGGPSPMSDTPTATDGGTPSIAEEATETEQPEPPKTEEPPEEVPGAIIDPELTGIVVRVGPATEEDLKRGYVTFRGRIKVDVNYDFRPIGNEEDFVPASIPIGSPLRGNNLNFNARQSRLFFEGGKLSSLGPLVGHVSADFYGEGASGGNLRVYEAYATIGPLLAGRKWSTFMGLEAIPDTLDFQGPGSMLAARREMLRYAPTLGPLLLQVSLERPDPDITLGDVEAEAVRTPLPDLAGSVEWDFAEGRNVRVASMARWFSYYAFDGPEDTAVGWGAMFNGLWTWKRTGWRASAQVHYGSGLGSYISDLAGQGLDAVVVAPGRLETVDSLGFYVGLEPQWTEWLGSTFVYGYLEVLSPPASLPPTTLKRTHYLSGNIKVRPVPSFEFGSELLFGRREDLDGAGDNAVRLILSTRFFY